MAAVAAAAAVVAASCVAAVVVAAIAAAVADRADEQVPLYTHYPPLFAQPSAQEDIEVGIEAVNQEPQVTFEANPCRANSAVAAAGLGLVPLDNVPVNMSGTLMDLFALVVLSALEM